MTTKIASISGQSLSRLNCDSILSSFHRYEYYKR